MTKSLRFIKLKRRLLFDAGFCHSLLGHAVVEQLKRFSEVIRQAQVLGRSVVQAGICGNRAHTSTCA
jgi:hypothetical protein